MPNRRRQILVVEENETRSTWEKVTRNLFDVDGTITERERV